MTVADFLLIKGVEYELCLVLYNRIFYGNSLLPNELLKAGTYLFKPPGCEDIRMGKLWL